MNAVAELQKNQSVTPAAPCVCPDVNIYETQSGYVLEAEMPGVTKDNLEVTMEGNTLTISGKRTDAEPKAQTLYRESKRADYRRVFELDPTIDMAKVQAQMNRGILTLDLPKAEVAKPRRIEVA